MIAKSLFIIFHVVIATFIHGAADDSPTALILSDAGKLNDFIGYAQSKRSKAVLSFEYITPTACSIIFMYAESPMLTGGDRLEQIVTELSRTRSAYKRTYQKFEQRLRKAIAQDNLLKTEQKSELEGVYEASFYVYDILLTERTLNILYRTPESLGDISRKLHATPRYRAPAYICLHKYSYRIFDCGDSYKKLPGADTTAKARILQEQYPERAFHLLFDNATWQKRCAQYRDLPNKKP